MKNIFLIILTVYLSSCNPAKNISTTKSTNTVEITFKSAEAITIENKTFEITLYGHDKNISEKKATYVFTDNTVQIDSLPFTIVIEIPEKTHLLLNPSTLKKDAHYYLSALCDNNKDERLKNKGDIMIDFDTQYPAILLKKNIENIVYLKEIK